MESLAADLSDLQLEEKYRRYRVFLQTLVTVHRPEAAWSLPELVKDNLFKEESDDEHERRVREELEAKLSDAELATVRLRYLPDFIQMLRSRRDYWLSQYRLHKDPNSEMKWKKYQEKATNETIKHMTVIKNLEKQLPNHNLSQSLKPERVQKLVNYIKEKESNDDVLEALMSAAIFCFDMEHLAYVKYAIYARYGEYIFRPSRSRWLATLDMEEDEGNINQSA